MAAKQGFLMYYSKGDAIGTRVSVRYRRSGRLSEVVVKRVSTVYTHVQFILPPPTSPLRGIISPCCYHKVKTVASAID